MKYFISGVIGGVVTTVWSGLILFVGMYIGSEYLGKPKTGVQYRVVNK